MQDLIQKNLQLLKDQTHYSNVFVRSYESFKEFIQNKNEITLKNFLEQLECFTNIVRLWNKIYNGKEAQIKNGFNKEKIIKEIQYYLENEKDKQIKLYLSHFITLINQQNKNSLGSENIYKNIKKKEMNGEELRNIGYEIQIKNKEVEQYVENQKKNDFPDFNPDLYINNDNNNIYYTNYT